MSISMTTYENGKQKGETSENPSAAESSDCSKAQARCLPQTASWLHAGAYLRTNSTLWYLTKPKMALVNKIGRYGMVFTRIG